MNNKNSALLSFRIISFLGVILVSFTYLFTLNIQLGKTIHSDPDTIEVCYETENDLSTDFEMDFLDDLIVKAPNVAVCPIFFTDETKQKTIKNQSVNPIHLDILIPPPRLKS